MKKYGGLLQRAAEKLNIRRGKSESESDYKMRIIYSVVSQIALASLWDTNEEREHISIEYFKKRVRDTMGDYATMYREISAKLPQC